jgi:cellulose synthase/poly-beta-1,6-N-acetylglucosamine synthase-like glycosyltransferase
MNAFQAILMYIVWFISTYFVVLFILLVVNQQDTLFERSKYNLKKPYPKVSMILPAFNEENTIYDSLKSLQRIDYPKDKLEIIVINDGSSDNTSKIIKKYLTKYPNEKIIYLDNQNNKGKAHRLNQGIKIATGKYVVCMDADTKVKQNILKKTIPDFYDDQVGAVTVSIDLKPKNLLQKITEVEYAIGLSLSIKLLSILDSVHVTPGPFTIFRKKMLNEIGGFDINNITEDTEIAYRIKKAGYLIKCNLNTKVYTDVPDTLKKLFKQRKRWYTGSLQTVKQHKDVLFKKKYGLFGIFVPYSFTLITLGTLLFLITLGTSIYNSVKNILYYRFTNFNFLDRLLNFEIDVLSIFSIFGILILVSFMLSIFIGVIGLSKFRKDISKNLSGFIAFIPFAIFYQIFWLSSIYSFIFNKEVKWR